MKKMSSLACIAAVASLPAFAEPTLYGKANVSLENASQGDDSALVLQSNASRIGIKGSEKLDDTGLVAFYKFEYETFIDDGDKSGKTFSQRNIYVGLKGNFGGVQAGMFDTPFKLAQKKVDLFNDLRGDIKNIITNSDNRSANSVSYFTPSTLGGFKANMAYIASEDPEGSDAVSLSVAYETNGFYIAAAMDSGVESESTDATRLVGQYNLNSLQLGLLYETEENDNADSTSGWVASVKYGIDKVSLKAQYGSSDIQEEGGESLSLGIDYKMSKTFKTFAFFTNEKSDAGTENDYLGVGAELKF